MMDYVRSRASIFGIPSITTIILCMVLTVIFKHFLDKFRRDPKLEQLAATLPGPATLPLLGNGLDFYFGGPNATKKIMEYSEKYGSLYRLWFGKHLIIGMTDVHDLEIVFGSSKMLGKSELFKPFQDVWGDGLFTGPKYIWKKTRKLYQPLYMNSTLSNYVNDFNDKIYQYVDKMKHLVNGPMFDSWDYLPYLSFDIISKTALDSEIDPHDKKVLKFHNNVKSGMELSFLRMFRPWLHVKIIYQFLLKKKVDTVRNNMMQFSKEIVAKKEPELQKSSLKEATSAFTNKSFLTMAYHFSNNSNLKNLIHDEIITTITGGTDTIAITNSFFLLSVAAYPHIQDKLYDELYEVYGDGDRVADESDLIRLNYLDQTLRETLRRFTLVPVVFRHVDEDVQIGSRIFPAGTELMISSIGVHFNPEYYPNPWEFNPDNFAPDAVEKRHKLTFLPFSAGPRNCIGLNYAMLEMKLTLIALLRTYSFHTTVKLEDVKMNMGFLLTSLDGYKMSIKLRDRRPSYMRV